MHHPVLKLEDALPHEAAARVSLHVVAVARIKVLERLYGVNSVIGDRDWPTRFDEVIKLATATYNENKRVKGAFKKVQSELDEVEGVLAGMREMNAADPEEKRILMGMRPPISADESPLVSAVAQELQRLVREKQDRDAGLVELNAQLRMNVRGMPIMEDVQLAVGSLLADRNG